MIISSDDYKDLKLKANQIRAHIINMTTQAGSGHPGGALSSVELLVALYFRIMRHDPQNPLLASRDRFVISKGHAVPVVYATLAEAGYFPVEWLSTLRHINSRLQGHPSRLHTPGIDATTGALGQGISIGIGMAVASQLKGLDYQVYVLIGDGELDEGQIWEAAASAPVMKLKNLTVILDNNQYQLSDHVDIIMPKGPIRQRWIAFGWDVYEIYGHDFEEIIKCFGSIGRKVEMRPSLIIAHTVKGKGISFMENNNHFHGIAPTQEEAIRAISELEQEKLILIQSS